MPSACTFNEMVSSNYSLESDSSTSALYTISEKVFIYRQRDHNKGIVSACSFISIQCRTQL